MRTKKKWALIGAAMVLAMVVGVSAPSASAQSAANVKVMVIAPTKTQIANFPDMPAAAIAAVKAINKRGGVGARHQNVTLVYCNDSFSPNGAAACARRAADEGVVALVGGFSSFGASIFPVLEKAGIPAVGWWPSVQADFTSLNAFLIGTGTLGGYVGQAKAAKDAGKKNIATVSASATSPTGDRVKAGAKMYGLTYRGTYNVAPTTKDYAPVIAQLQQQGVQSVSLAVGGVQATQIISAADQLGFRPLWLNADGNMTTDNLKTLGALAKGITFVGSLPPAAVTSTNPAVRRMVSEYKGVAKVGFDDAELGATGAATWLAYQAFEQVTRGMSSVTASNVFATMKTAQGIDLYDIVPSWTPTKVGPKNFPRISNAFLYTSRWDGSKYVQLTPKPFDATAAFARIKA